MSDTARARLTGGLLFFALSFAFFAFVKWNQGIPSSVPTPYSVLQAKSFLQGRMDLDVHPETHDLSPHNGKVYSYFGPLPALMLMPFVNRNTDAFKFPTRWFSISLAAIATGLYFIIFHYLARLQSLRLSGWRLAALTLGFAIGSSNFIFALVGSQWFVVQLTASVATLLGLVFALRREDSFRRKAAMLSGLCLGLSVLARPNLVFALPVWAYLAVSDGAFGISRGKNLFTRESAIRVALVTAPCLLAVASLLWFNWARFGNPLEFGLSYHNMSERFRWNFLNKGMFNLDYFPHNAWITLLRPPFIDGQDGFDLGEGFSLFFQTPLLLLAFVPTGINGLGSLRRYMVTLTVPAALFILCCMGTGWWQFGARYLYDLVPFLAVAVFAARRWSTGLLVALAISGICLNYWGVVWFLSFH